MNVSELLSGKRICVCVGPGGVGKTTSAAAIALGMAAQGLKVAVVTIDPARRLADALGLDELDNEPRLIAAERLPGIELAGELWAMTLDPKQTFDELIDEVAGSPEHAAEIKRNHIYRQISGAISGSQEYTAVAKLHELSLSGRFDLVVLDTPPARNALDFLDAPDRLTAFLDGKALQALLAPTGLAARLLTPMLGALKRVTGVDVVTELTTFFALIGPMTAEFGARARAVDQLLHSDQTAFFIVTRAAPAPIDDALALHRALRERSLPFTAAIVNRFVSPVAGFVEVVDSDLIALCTPPLGADLAGRVAASVHDHNQLAARAAAELQRFRAEFNDEPMALIDEFDDDVHDSAGLALLYRQLFAVDR